MAYLSRYRKVSSSFDLAYFWYFETSQYVVKGVESEIPLPAAKSTRNKAFTNIREYHKDWSYENSFYFHL